MKRNIGVVLALAAMVDNMNMVSARPVIPEPPPFPEFDPQQKYKLTGNYKDISPLKPTPPMPSNFKAWSIDGYTVYAATKKAAIKKAEKLKRNE